MTSQILLQELIECQQIDKKHKSETLWATLEKVSKNACEYVTSRCPHQAETIESHILELRLQQSFRKGCSRSETVLPTTSISS